MRSGEMPTLGSVAAMTRMNAPIHKKLGHQSQTALLSGLLPKENPQRWNTGDKMSSASVAGYCGCSPGFYGNRHAACGCKLWVICKSAVKQLPRKNEACRRVTVIDNLGSTKKWYAEPLLTVFSFCPTAAIIVIVPFYSAFSASF